MKRSFGYISAVLLVPAVLIFGACGRNENTEVQETVTVEEAPETEAPAPEPVQEEAKEPASLKEIYDSIAGTVTLPEMYFADDDFLMNYYGIDAARLEEYVFASCLDSTSADSVILIRLKDEAYAGEVTDCLNMLLEQMSAEMENYNPEANEHVKAAQVRRNGNMIDLVIHQDRDAILAVIDNAL